MLGIKGAEFQILFFYASAVTQWLFSKLQVFIYQFCHHFLVQLLNNVKNIEAK